MTGYIGVASDSCRIWGCKWYLWVLAIRLSVSSALHIHLEYSGKKLGARPPSANARSSCLPGWPQLEVLAFSKADEWWHCMHGNTYLLEGQDGPKVRTPEKTSFSFCTVDCCQGCWLCFFNYVHVYMYISMHVCISLLQQDLLYIQ